MPRPQASASSAPAIVAEVLNASSVARIGWKSLRRVSVKNPRPRPEVVSCAPLKRKTMCGLSCYSAEAPKRGTFALLIPAEMCWKTTILGGTVRLDFRPRTRVERAARYKGGAP